MWEAAAKAVKDEEAVKEKLCDDLSQLVIVLIKCGFEMSQFHKSFLTHLSLIGSRKQ